MCLVGANTGCKTNLVRPHVLDEFDDRYIGTLGAKVSLKRLRLEHLPDCPPIGLDMSLWDLLSHREFSELLIDCYGHGTRGILAVADMTRRASLEEMGDWIRDVEQVVGEVPVVVIGANSDAAERREVSEDDVQALAQSYGAACFFASADSRERVEEAFMNLAERIVRRFQRDAASSPPASPLG